MCDQFNLIVDEMKTTSKGKKDDVKKEASIISQYSHWLMKSEPDSRYENGIDMKVKWF